MCREEKNYERPNDELSCKSHSVPFYVFEENSFENTITGADLPWYESLGLKEVESKGKLVTEKSKGDHLRFSLSELYQWIDNYFLE